MPKFVHLSLIALLGGVLVLAGEQGASARHPGHDYFLIESFSFGARSNSLDLDCDGITGPKTMTAFRSQLDAAEVRISDNDLAAIVRHVVDNSRRAPANATRLAGCVSSGRICYEIPCGGRR